LEKKKDFSRKSSQNENIFVKMGELFTHFDKTILILRTFARKIRIFLMIFVSVHGN